MLARVSQERVLEGVRAPPGDVKTWTVHNAAMWRQSNPQTRPGPSSSHDVHPQNRGARRGTLHERLWIHKELTIPCPARSFTSSASWNLVTCVNKVERSRVHPFLRQVACTRAVR